MSDAGYEARSLAGGCLAAIGVLIAFLSGGCTLAMLAGAAAGGADAVVYVLVLGLPFVVFGIGLLFLGRLIMGKPRVSTPPDDGRQKG